MPHQLRRVIAINTVAGKTGEPSSLIAEMDVRGRAMAVGINGVGKTTFLRTIPLFYGATPREILKGTHRGSLIAYTLPTPASAIVYEYERASEEDLRCAVMYCKPGEDEAVFYILKGGYNEAFFVDEDTNFVDAPTFKARAEAAGVWVSEQLPPSRYRSVILRERSQGRTSEKNRDLYLEHSLGPKELRNLGPIAAAISTEKINFDDLRRIVVDLVTQDAQDTTKDGILTQKPIREDIKKWLETRDHVAAILAMEPEAKRLKEKADLLQKRHVQLCSLHSSARKALDKCNDRNKDAAIAIKNLEEAATNQENAINEKLKTLKDEIKTINDEHEALILKISTIENQKSFFAGQGVEALAELTERKSSIEAKLNEAEIRLNQLTSTVTDAQDRAKAQIKSIEASLGAQKEGFVLRRTAAHQAHTATLGEIQESERKERSAILATPLATELQNTLLQLQREKGGIEAELKSPQATEKTSQELAHAEQHALGLEATVLDREKAEGAKKTAKENAEKEAAQASADLDKINSTIEQAHERLAALKAELNPEDGSLLAFLRSHDQSLWRNAARAISPSLLPRTDLDPDLIGDSTDDDRISIGQVSLSVLPVDTPSWVNEEDLKKAIQAQETALAELRRKLEDSRHQAKAKASAAEVAKRAYDGAAAQTETAKAALEQARANRDNLAGLAATEREKAKVAAEDALEQTNARIEETKQAIEDAQEQRAGRLNEIDQDYEGRRQAVGEKLRMSLTSIDSEEQEAQTSFNESKQNITENLARELEGKGINPQDILDLESKVADGKGDLERISAGQGLLKSWRDFKKNDLPGLEGANRTLQETKRLVDAKKLQKSTLEGLIEELRESTRIRHDELSSEKRSVEQGAADLTRLLDGGLKVFTDRVPSNDDDISPEIICSQSQDALNRLSKESAEVGALCRTIRNEMVRHEDQIADWVRKRELEDLPDIQAELPHEYDRKKAGIICRWFEPGESDELVMALNKQRTNLFMAAGGFADVLHSFDRKVEDFESKLKAALKNIPSFHSIGELDVTIKSSISSLDYLKLLEKIKDRHRSLSGTIITAMSGDRTLPSYEDVALMREYRNKLHPDGGFSVNFRDQISLECRLRENNKVHTVKNSQEFSAISSTGLTALITSLFLMGFVQMIRGKDNQPAITWITDEIARLDSRNVASFLKALGEANINVLSATPNADPSLARHFERRYTFEEDGSIATPSIKGTKS